MTLFEDIAKIFAYDLQKKFCIEINFTVLNNNKFDNCWMGKMPDKETNQDVFWFGLTQDGLNAFDYTSFIQMSEAKVFDGKSLKDIWSKVQLLSIDGCDPEDRVADYI